MPGLRSYQRRNYAGGETINILQRIRAWFTRSHTAQNLYDRFRSWFEPQNIFTRRTTYTLATTETIFAAVSRLSNSMASLPLSLHREYQAVRTPTSDLMQNSPNPNMTSFDWVRTMEVMRNTGGNGYALKEYDMRYQVRALWILDPSKVKPVIEATSRELWYEIEGDNGRYYVHNMDMIHVKHIHTVGYVGISPIDVLRNTIDFDTKVKEFSLDQIDSAVKASFILRMDTHLSDEKKKEILESFRRFYQDNGGVLIQERGAEIKEIERKFIDTRVFEVERITRTRVATVYNIPAHMLGESEGLKPTNAEQIALEYVQYTLIPIVRQYEQELNRKMLNAQERQQGYTYRFDTTALLRADLKTLGEYYNKGIRSGWLKPNDARAREYLPPEPGGDVLYMSRDLSPIGNRKEAN